MLAKSFFCAFMDRDEVEVHKLAKKRTRPISSHLDQTNLVNKGFIIWLSGKFFVRDTAGSPARARWLYHTRSGSQSHRAIWFILPARGASHIIRSVIKNIPGMYRLGPKSFSCVQCSVFHSGFCFSKAPEIFYRTSKAIFN